jgi:hypothetical protein
MISLCRAHWQRSAKELVKELAVDPHFHAKRPQMVQLFSQRSKDPGGAIGGDFDWLSIRGEPHCRPCESRV